MVWLGAKRLMDYGLRPDPDQRLKAELVRDASCICRSCMQLGSRGAKNADSGTNYILRSFWDEPSGEDGVKHC